MGVYLPNMEMPKSCGKCKLFDGSHAIGLFAPLGWCRVNGKEIFLLSEKANFCPLVPIPPHGDLIDRDALRDNNCDAFEINGADGTVLAMDVSIIDAAPIIIPGEDGE